MLIIIRGGARVLMIGCMFSYSGRRVYNWVGLINGGGGGRGFYAAVYRNYI